MTQGRASHAFIRIVGQKEVRVIPVLYDSIRKMRALGFLGIITGIFSYSSLIMMVIVEEGRHLRTMVT